jgi:hypothetical protein
LLELLIDDESLAIDASEEADFDFFVLVVVLVEVWPVLEVAASWANAEKAKAKSRAESRITRFIRAPWFAI